jgi:hypothetical protein
MGRRRNGRPGGVKRRTVEQRINAKRATAHLHTPDRGEVDPHTGETWGGIPGSKMALGAVDSDVLATAAVTTAKIADEAVGSTKISAGLTNPGQDTPGLRSIGPALGAPPCAYLPATTATVQETPWTSTTCRKCREGVH